MSVSLTINGVEKKSKVMEGSLRITNMMTRRRDTCSFVITSHSGDTYVPLMGQEVIIMDGSTKIFGGIITKIDSSPMGYQAISHNVQCQDYTRLLDRKLVPDTYANMTVNEILADMQTKYFPAGFTINNVNASVEVKYVGFNYKPLARCLEELADSVGYDWYVDYDKDVHFFAKETLPAPFDVNDNDGSYVYNSMIIRKDNTQVRNSIIVRGGDYLGDSFTAELLTNGTDFIFPIPYKFTDFAATLTGDPLSVGVDYINDPENYDALYNFNEKILRFKESDTPSAGSVIRYSGKPNLPVIVKLNSAADIATMSAQEGSGGVYEYLIVDKSIGSKEGARQRARAEIIAYADTLTEGEFTTYLAGLKAGQAVLINSTSRGVSETYIINQVTISQYGTDAFKYDISLITTKTLDLIDVLRGLLFATTKNVEINEGEVIDLVENFDEIINMGETVTAHPVDYGVEFSLGTFTGHTFVPQGVKRIFRLNYSPLH